MTELRGKPCPSYPLLFHSLCLELSFTPPVSMQRPLEAPVTSASERVTVQTETLGSSEIRIRSSPLSFSVVLNRGQFRKLGHQQSFITVGVIGGYGAKGLTKVFNPVLLTAWSRPVVSTEVLL